MSPACFLFLSFSLCRPAALGSFGPSFLPRLAPQHVVLIGLLGCHPANSASWLIHPSLNYYYGVLLTTYLVKFFPFSLAPCQTDGSFNRLPLAVCFFLFHISLCIFFFSFKINLPELLPFFNLFYCLTFRLMRVSLFVPLLIKDSDRSSLKNCTMDVLRIWYGWSDQTNPIFCCDQEDGWETAEGGKLTDTEIMDGWCPRSLAHHKHKSRPRGRY